MDFGNTVLMAALALFAGITLERHKHETDRRGVASALADEIAAWIYSIEKRKQVEDFTQAVQRLRSGQGGPGPYAWSDPLTMRDPVLTAYISKIGTLGGALPERVARFYTILEALRSDLRRLSGPEFNGNPNGAADVIQSGLELWAEGAAEGKALVRDLQNVAATRRGLFQWLG